MNAKFSRRGARLRRSIVHFFSPAPTTPCQNARVFKLAMHCLVVGVLTMPAVAAQSPVAAGDGGQAAAPAPPDETVDIFELLRKLRKKEPDAEAEPWDPRKPMMAFAPVIGAKPSAGVLFGAAGNVAFYRGDPATTRISSMVASVTFSTKKQIAITDRFTMFARDNRWRVEADHRFQWTSLETYRARHQRRHRGRHRRRLRFLQAAPYGLPAAATGAVRRRRPVFRQPHRRRPRLGCGARVGRFPVRHLQPRTRPPARLAGRGGHELRPPLGQSRQLHQRRSRMARQDQLSPAVRRLPWRRFDLAEAQPGSANLRRPVA